MNYGSHTEISEEVRSSKMQYLERIHMYSCDIVLATNYLLKEEFLFMLCILRIVGHIYLNNRLFIKSVKHHLNPRWTSNSTNQIYSGKKWKLRKYFFRQKFETVELSANERKCCLVTQKYMYTYITYFFLILKADN